MSGWATPARVVRRRRTLRSAVLGRIGRAGDMNIRVRGETLRIILSMCASAPDVADWSSYREVDAIALETLIQLGEW